MSSDAAPLKRVAPSSRAALARAEPVSFEAGFRPLNEIERLHAPDPFYYAGDPSLLRSGRRVSVVGSRQASPHGLKRAARLARELAAKDVIVVSGLALGIDTVAHRTAIDAGGRTIAVLATPLDDVTPRQNAALQRLIMREHLAISQFPPGHPVLRSNYPRRNRTMALVSDATVIVEAGEGSGSLSQGWETLRLGRPLFLMRSIVDDAGLKWPAEMLGYGAEILSEPKELFELLPEPGLDDSVVFF